MPERRLLGVQNQAHVLRKEMEAIHEESDLRIFQRIELVF
jgi:hypothetical protein